MISVGAMVSPVRNSNGSKSAPAAPRPRAISAESGQKQREVPSRPRRRGARRRASAGNRTPARRPRCRRRSRRRGPYPLRATEHPPRRRHRRVELSEAELSASITTRTAATPPAVSAVRAGVAPLHPRPAGRPASARRPAPAGGRLRSAVRDTTDGHAARRDQQRHHRHRQRQQRRQQQRPADEDQLHRGRVQRERDPARPRVRKNVRQADRIAGLIGGKDSPAPPGEQDQRRVGARRPSPAPT